MVCGLTMCWSGGSTEMHPFPKHEDMNKDHRGVVKKFMRNNLKEEVIDTIVEKSAFQNCSLKWSK